MPTHVLVNKLGLTYKGAIGTSMATMPDVCKTPSPGGPIPVPYPNIAMQSSLKKGTTSVKAKRKMIAVKGSQYSRSNGDEAGTAGGIKSSVNMKATDWITYSFNVKMQGKNACRNTDRKFHNNKNTICSNGQLEPGFVIQEIKDVLCEKFCEELADGWKSSHDLEKKLAKDEECADLNLKFPPDTSTNSSWEGDWIPTTIPDVSLYDDVGNVIQCFDFKGPGDRWRDDQYWRQTQVAGRPPIEISEKECDCAG